MGRSANGGSYLLPGWIAVRDDKRKMLNPMVTDMIPGDVYNIVYIYITYIRIYIIYNVYQSVVTTDSTTSLVRVFGKG